MKRIVNIIGTQVKILCYAFIGGVLIAFDTMLDLKTEQFFGTIQIVFETVIAVAGFWVTLYLLLFELYKDRYPFKLFENKYLYALKQNIVYIAFSAVYGLLVITRKDYLLESIFYILFSIAVIFVIGEKVYSTSNTMTISNCVDDYCRKLTDRFASNDCKIDRECLNDLKHVFDECIIKEEFSVAQRVSSCCGEVFRDFMKNSISFIDSGSEQKNVEKSFKMIARFGCEQLYECKGIKSVVLKRDLVYQQYCNLKFCIEANQFDFFKIYANELLELTRNAIRNKEDELVDITFSLYSNVLVELLENKKGDWIDYIIKEVYIETITNSYFFTSDYVKNFMHFLTAGLLCDFAGDYYEKMFCVLEDITIKIRELNYGFSSIIVFYVALFNSIKDNKKDYLERFLDSIMNDGSATCADTRWIEFKFHCIKDMKSHGLVVSKVDTYLIALLSQVIELKDLYKSFLVLPDYNETICLDPFSEEKIKRISDDYMLLFDRAIVSENVELYYMILRNFDKCILASEREHKDIQCGLFKVYVSLLKKSRRLTNRQFFEMTFLRIDSVIKELDKEKKISQGFGDFILHEIEKQASSVDSKMEDVILWSIDLLHGFESDEYNFCIKTDRKMQLSQAIYNIGIGCIENDYEEGVRKASNALGWMTIEAIKQGTGDLVKYRLDLAEMMLNIARKMKVSIKTETFLVTLFTTVGMFCYKKPGYKKYRDKVLAVLTHVDEEIIRTAIDIRTYENDMWDSLMDNRTKEYVVKLMKDCFSGDLVVRK